MYSVAITDNFQHHAISNNAQALLSSISTNSKRKLLPCLEGWKMAISCLVGLWKDLHEVHGLNFLLTSRLNQDCLENFFSIMRGKGGRTSRQPGRSAISFCV